MNGRFPIFLILAVVIVIVMAVLSQDPGQSERLAEMRRFAAFQGETRDIVIGVVCGAVAIFSAYLLVTRR